MIGQSLLALAGLAGLAAAAPATTLEARTNCRSVYADLASYSSPCNTYTSALTCPNGIQKKKNGVVLLVHGTGSTGKETWGDGPYLKLLPDQGFDVCYVDLPNRALSDMQTSAEYVAYLSRYLAGQSATGKVGLVTHSQGGPLVQWALRYWPTTRGHVSSFVAVAPDFEGTAEGNPACLVLGLATGGCNPSVIQQSKGSNYIKALEKGAGSAFVPTTSIYTAYDDVIQPELLWPTSQLDGATVVRLQDVCGDGYVMEHFGIPFASYPYYLALDALKNKRAADVSTVQKSACSWILDDYLLADFNRGPSVLKEVAADALAVILGGKVTKEPALRSYVCKAGDSTNCS